jgi:LAS superfamily LD-carboxypeptidase LdcB
MNIIITESQFNSLSNKVIKAGENQLFKKKNNVLNTYLSGNTALIPLYKEIETSLGDKFTSNHFEKEIAYSGGLKTLATGLSTDMLKSFKNMLKNNGLLSKVTYSVNSYRDFENQKKTFIKYAKVHGGTISGGLKQAALPGFSQHHTGKALDFSPSSSLSNKTLKEYGFKRPYNVENDFRMVEPWHIIYTE